MTFLGYHASNHWSKNLVANIPYVIAILLVLKLPYSLPVKVVLILIGWMPILIILELPIYSVAVLGSLEILVYREGIFQRPLRLAYSDLQRVTYHEQEVPRIYGIRIQRHRPALMVQFKDGTEMRLGGWNRPFGKARLEAAVRRLADQINARIAHR